MIEKQIFKPNFKVTKKDFLFGISFGLVFAYILYNLFYIFRNIFRICNQVESNFFLELTKEEAYFFNFLFAFIALTISKSLIFTFWIRRQPVKNIKNLYFRKRIIHEQWAFLNYFLHWFLKMAIFIGLLAIEVFYILETYTNYFWSYILLLLVLFLSSWQSFLLKYKKGHLIMLKSFVVITLFALVFPLTNLFDENRIHFFNKSNNIIENKIIQLPKASYYENHNKRENIYIFEKDSCLNKFIDSVFKPMCINDINFSNNFLCQLHEYEKFYENEIDFKPIINLNADQNIKLKEINYIKILLKYNSSKKINFKIIPEGQRYNKRFYVDFVVPFHLNCIYKESSKIEELIKIHIQEKTITLDGKTLSLEKFKEEYSKIISINPKIYKEIYFEDNATYQQYITVLSYIYKENLDYKNKLSLKRHYRDYNSLRFDRQYKIDSMAPLNYLEIIPYSQVKDFFDKQRLNNVPLPPPPPPPLFVYSEEYYNGK